MMKIFLCLFLVSGINYVSCLSSSLSRDLNEIGAVIPKQDLFQIFDPVKFDPASHKASIYVGSTDFHNSMYLLLKHPFLKPVKNYLELSGVDINDLFLRIVTGTEKSNSQPILRKSYKLVNFIEKAYSISQMDNIVSLVIHKTATSSPFRTLYNMLNGLNHIKLHSDVTAIPKVQDMMVNLNNVGINTKEIWKALSYLFGWDKVTNIISLEEYEIEEEDRNTEESPLLAILHQYLDLIPKEKFIFLYRGLLVNPLFQEITVYIYNKKYNDVITKFDKYPLIGDFFDYLKNQGVSFNKLLDLIRDRLGFTFAYYRIPAGKHEENSHSFSLIKFFDLAKQILPVNEIRKLTATLLDTSTEYRMLSEKILQLVFNNNIELYFENQLEIRSTAMQYGFEINKMLNFIFLLIGVEYEVPVKGNDFTESIYEFVELFPKTDYIKLYDQYKNDTNIWKMVSYLKGPKFADFIEALFSTVELKIFFNFLIKQYVPFKAILIDVLDRLGIMQWWINYDYFCANGNKKCLGAMDPNSDNLYDFVKKRISLFPLKEILILFHSKLQKSQHFQNLYLLVSKIDGANLFKKITEHDVLRDFFVKLTKIGYNFRAIVQHFSQLFGWGNLLSVDLSLNQTIENFDNLIYRKELFKILKKYPNEVEQVKELFKNSAFINSMNIYANIPEIKNIIIWMENLNVPVIDYFNFYSGQDTPNEYHLRLDTQLKWKQMSTDLTNFLKKNKFFDFSISQKYSSIEFHALLEKVLFLNFKAIFALYMHPETIYLTDKLQTTGIDFPYIYQFLNDVENDAIVLHRQ